MQSVFWSQYGSPVAMALIVLFGLTSAFSTGSYCKEAAGGHLEILSTFPGVTYLHSAVAWWICSMVWTLAQFGLCAFVFACILKHTNFLIPAVNLLIYGVAMGTIADVVVVDDNNNNNNNNNSNSNSSNSNINNNNNNNNNNNT